MTPAHQRYFSTSRPCSLAARCERHRLGFQSLGRLGPFRLTLDELWLQYLSIGGTAPPARVSA